MNYQHPASEQLKVFIAELEQKQQRIVATMTDSQTKCDEELRQLSQQLHTASVQLLKAESNGDSNTTSIELTVASIKKKILEARENSKRYEGVTTEQLLSEDFPKLREYALASQKERAKVAQSIAKERQEKQAQIEKLKTEIFALSEEERLFPFDFEETCAYKIASFLPGSDALNSYESGRTDYTRKGQINNMLFGQGGEMI